MFRNYIASADRSVEGTPEYEQACAEMLEKLKAAELNTRIQTQIPNEGILYGERRKVTDTPPKWWLIMTGREQ